MMRGDLVLVGGAEILYRRPILTKFISLASAHIANSRFGVLASATGRPEVEFRKIQTWFQDCGVDPLRLVLLKASSLVPGWEGGAKDPSQVRVLESLQGLWLLGGDQNLTMKLLLEPDGSDSRLLQAIRRRSLIPGAAGGLVIGGTSAGAAVMSALMIGGGTSFGALALPRATEAGGAEITRALWVLPGLGLFPEGIIDQHFDTRARLGRLIEAGLVEGGGRLPAFGIDEATALVRNGATGKLELVGRGGVTILDFQGARRDHVDTRDGRRLRIRGVTMSYLTEGDSYNPEGDAAGTDRFDFGSKVMIRDDDAGFAVEHPEASGILSPYGSAALFASRMLLDNDPKFLFRDSDSGLPYVRSLLIEEDVLGEGRGSLGWEIRLSRQGGSSPSRLFYDGHYSFTGVGIDILPIDVSISRSF